jgi:hypothetical protein
MCGLEVIYDDVKNLIKFKWLITYILIIFL